MNYNQIIFFQLELGTPLLPHQEQFTFATRGKLREEVNCRLLPFFAHFHGLYNFRGSICIWEVGNRGKKRIKRLSAVSSARLKGPSHAPAISLNLKYLKENTGKYPNKYWKINIGNEILENPSRVRAKSKNTQNSLGLS